LIESMYEDIFQSTKQDISIQISHRLNLE